MKRVVWIVGYALLFVTGLLFSRPDRSRAAGNNTMYVELRKLDTGGSECNPLGGHRVDLVEDGVTTTHYTEGDGATSFTVSTPVNGEQLTIKYYRTNGTLAGTRAANIQTAGPDDPWAFNDGSSMGGNCATWNFERTVHIVYSPS